MAFVHLGIRSEYAIVDSIIRIKQLVAKAKDDGQPSLALADPNNMFAAVKFYKACLSAGIKPILGVEATIGDEVDWLAEKNNFQVILYAMNNDGYKNLLRLLSDAYTGRPMGNNGTVEIHTPIITKDALFERNDGIIAILTHRSHIAPCLNSNHPQAFVDLVKPWQDVFGDRLYVAIKRTHPQDDAYNRQALIWASKCNIPIIAHNDVRFLEDAPKIQMQGKDNEITTDFDAHEARVCIASGYKLDDSTRPRIYSQEQYFKTQQQMQELFGDIPQVIANTELLASRCNVTLTLGINVLPDFPIPEGDTVESFFRKVSADGLNKRLDLLYPVHERGDDWLEFRKKYDERLNYELDIIIKMGFPGYFLIVMDFIRWAKANGVPVGPGRGSGAGSLVAYALNITDLDPLRYDLLFERFLNPERVSMPDFDIDFCIEGRDRVIDYVAQAYGRQAVSQIITFGTMAARAVVRDVARVQDKSYGLADRISKLIPKTPGISLDEAVSQEPLLKDLLGNENNADHKDATEIWEVAKRLEGLTRNVGKHAGGVLIAPNRISDFSAVYCDDKGHPVSQFDKDDVEAVGLVKFDFLGLRNLTVIQSAINNINHTRHKLGQDDIVLEKLPLDDDAVYDAVLQTGNTTAVFQLESSGMKKYLKQLKPTNIEDVIAMCALYRPGPLESGMVSDFIERKQGLQDIAYPSLEYQHDSLQPALESTYGVIVYQEQVMQIAQVLAGYTLGGADMLRRAMGKKKPEEMEKQRSIFVDGAIAQNIDGELAGQIFALVEKFAGYGFNKSHSAAYGVLAYQTAYLKYYYPAEFMAAVLTSEMDNTDAVVFLIDDCKTNFNIKVIPPNINHSQWHFAVKDSKTIVYGLGAVKGVGEDAVASIVQARKQGGEFKDLYDFCNRVNIKKVGKRTLEALVCAGCFDAWADTLTPHFAQEPHQIRGGLWAQLPDAIHVADINLQNANNGTMDLFSEIDDSLSVAPPLPDIIWGDQTRLYSENKTLGLYLTGHPLDKYRHEAQHFVSVASLSKLSDSSFDQPVRVLGLIVDIANFGDRIAITLDDGTARLEVSCFTDKYLQLKPVLEPKRLNESDIKKIDRPDIETVDNLNGAIIVATISVRERDGRIFARLMNAITLPQARLNHLTSINIKMHAHDSDKLNQLIMLLKEHRRVDESQVYVQKEPLAQDDNKNAIKNPTGYLPVSLFVYDECGIAKVATNERWQLYPSNDSMDKLYQLFDNGHLAIK